MTIRERASPAEGTAKAKGLKVGTSLTGGDTTRSIGKKVDFVLAGSVYDPSSAAVSGSLHL